MTLRRPVPPVPEQPQQRGQEEELPFGLLGSRINLGVQFSFLFGVGSEINSLLLSLLCRPLRSVAAYFCLTQPT